MLHLIIATVLFYILHSVLAANTVKRWAREHLGLDRWYRALYTLVSTGLFAWVVIAYRATPVQTLVATGTLLDVVGWSLMIGGSALSLLAVMRFGSMEFIGIFPERPGELIRTGLHGSIRHPIYTGVILALVGWLMVSTTLATLLVVMISMIYLPIGIHLEERKLVERFGDAYLRYRKEVPALVPWPSGKDPGGS